MPKRIDPDKEHKVYYKKYPQGNHTTMSPETREVLTRIETELSGMKVHAAERAKDIEFIKEIVERIESGLLKLTMEKQEEHKILFSRVTTLENWKLQFVAKVAIYSSIGLFLGSVMAQVLIKWLSNKF